MKRGLTSLALFIVVVFGFELLVLQWLKPLESRLLDSFGAGRSRQARALADAVSEPVAVVGADLNTWSPDFMESAVEVLHSRFTTTPVAPEPTYHAGGLLARKLDHLMMRLPDGWSASVRRAAGPYGSDHYPLIGVITREAATTLAGG